MRKHLLGISVVVILVTFFGMIFAASRRGDDYYANNCPYRATMVSVQSGFKALPALFKQKTVRDKGGAVISQSEPKQADCDPYLKERDATVRRIREDLSKKYRVFEVSQPSWSVESNGEVSAPDPIIYIYRR